MKEKIIAEIIKNKLIVIVRAVAREHLIPLVQALYDGGVRLVEVTYSADGRVSDVETAQMIGDLAREFDGRMCIGAGTVLTAEQVALTHAAGGSFIISPDTNGQVIARTLELGMVSIPGAMTPTEIQQAHSFGADFVKLFPVSCLGADYVKAVSAPLSQVRLLAVGGIGIDNMREYLRAGVVGFGVGGSIVSAKLIGQGDFDAVSALARSYVEACGNG